MASHLESGAVVLVLTLLAAASEGRAQPVGHPEQPPKSGTYLDTSFEADEALARAAKLADGAKWSAAATAFQEVGERFAGRLARLDQNRHISVRDHVNRTIANWPPPGLTAYRGAFESRARKALDAARAGLDLEPLVRLADRYYATSAGADALIAAGDLAIERGDFATARQWLQQLLRDHPDRERLRMRLRAKLALCAAWAGDIEPLRTLIGELPPDQPGPEVTWAGRRRALGDFLRDALSEIGSAEPPSRVAPGATTFAGGPSRGGFYESNATAEAVFWHFDGFAGKSDRRARPGRTNLVQSESARRALRGGQRVTMAPVVGGGLVYVHDHRSVWAIDPDSADDPAWRYDLVANRAAESRSASDDELPSLFTSTYHDGRLYVHLDRDPPSSIDGNVGEASVVVCLDARTGRELWRNDLTGFASEFEETRVDGAPLIHGGRMFVVVRKRKPFGFEAGFLMRLDPRTGRTVWTTHVGEAATGSYGYRRPTLTHAAARGDRVFLQTNLGTVVAVSATTGRVAWLRRYETGRSDDMAGLGPSRLNRQARSWHYQPTTLWRHAVICAPLDCEAILVLDQNDGREISTIPFTNVHMPQYIAGVHGDLLYAVGAQVVAWDLRKAAIAWARPLAAGQILGRGMLATSGVFIPTTDGLLRYPLDGGPAVVQPWPLESAGNLVAMGDQIVVAAPDAVYGLLRKDEAFARLARRMKAQPRDPLPALRLSELAFKTHDYDRGLTALQQAVARAGGFARLTDDGLRARFFRDFTSFATLLMEARQTNPPNKRIEQAVSLLRQAGQCAPTPACQVGFRLQLAGAHVMGADIPAAVEVCQQILGDRSLRRLPMTMQPDWRPPGRRRSTDSIEDGEIIDAADLARRWIDRLTADYGGGVYDAVERRARDRLEIVASAGDADGMLDVVAEFPNSRAAGAALLAHARLERRRAHWKPAARSYRRALDRVSHSERPAIIRELAMCLLQAGRTAASAEWLDRAVRDYPAERIEHDGRIVNFRELRQLLVGHLEVRDVSLPRVTWPLRRAYQRLHPESAAVLEPVFDRLPQTRWDAVLTFAGGRLELRSPTTDRPLWPDPLGLPTQPQLLGMDADRFYLVTRHRILAVGRQSGRVAWQYGEAPPSDPHADPEWTAAWANHAMTSTHLFSASDKRELVCLELKDGTLRWRIEDGPRAGSTPVADREHVIYANWRGKRNFIQVLDAETGQRTRTIALDEDRPVQTLRLTPDGLLLVVMSNVVIGVDPQTGATRWRTADGNHFLLATLQMDDEGLYLSADGITITKHDLDNGRRLWTTPPIGTIKRDGLWTSMTGGVLYAASADGLMAFDTADGGLLWKAADPPGLKLQVPRIVEGAIVTLSAVPPATDARRKQPREADRGTRHRIRRYALSDGRELPAGEDAEVVLDDVRSLGGLFARDRCLLILDGPRLIGYVGPEP